MTRPTPTMPRGFAARGIETATWSPLRLTREQYDLIDEAQEALIAGGLEPEEARRELLLRAAEAVLRATEEG